MRRSVMSKLSLVGLALALTLLFQNCSCASDNINFATSFDKFTAGPATGNGDPYDGKPDPGTYYRIVPGTLCNHQYAVPSQIQVTENSLTLRSLDQTDCSYTEQTLESSQLEHASYNPLYLGHKEGIYKKLDQPPDLGQSGVAIPQAWCRVRSATNINIDTIIEAEPQTDELKATLRLAKIDAQSGLVPGEENIASVSRELIGSNLKYSGQDFELTINRNSSFDLNGTSHMLGSLNAKVDGQFQNYQVYCRNGGLLDPVVPTLPTLAFRFAEKGAVDQLLPERATAASFFDQTGLLIKAPPNTARIDYDPVSKTPLGLLLENSSQNWLQRSEEMDSIPWVLENMTVNSDVAETLAPDGTQTADRLIETTGTGFHLITQRFLTTGPNKIYSFSAHIKVVSEQTAPIVMMNISSEDLNDYVSAFFNTATGAIALSPTAGGAGSQASAKIKNIGNGWVRYEVSGIATTSSQRIGVNINFKQNATGPNQYVGNGQRSIYLWGAQLEEAPMASSYIATTGTVGTRDADRLVLDDTSWYSSGQGTWFTDIVIGKTPIVGSRMNILSLSNTSAGSAVERLSFGFFGPSEIQAHIQADSVSSPSTLSVPANLVPDDFIRLLFAFSPGDSILVSKNSNARGPSNLQTAFSPTQMQIGASSTYNGFHGHLKSIIYWPTRLPDDELSRLEN